MLHGQTTLQVINTQLTFVHLLFVGAPQAQVQIIQTLRTLAQALAWVAQHEAARRHGHGDGGQHGRQQADERQETVGAVQRHAKVMRKPWE